jgi:hypothetical protein
MSVSGDLVCVDCHSWLWLGKAMGPLGLPWVDSYIAGGGRILNWENSELNRGLWKFLAEHAAHRLEINLDNTERYVELINREGRPYCHPGDVPPWEEYLDGWPGNGDAVPLPEEPPQDEQAGAVRRGLG